MAAPWVVVRAAAFAIVKAAFWVLVMASIWADNRAAKSVAARLLIAVSDSASNWVELFDDKSVVEEPSGDQNGSFIVIYIKIQSNNSRPDRWCLAAC